MDDIREYTRKSGDDKDANRTTAILRYTTCATYPTGWTPCEEEETSPRACGCEGDPALYSEGPRGSTGDASSPTSGARTSTQDVSPCATEVLGCMPFEGDCDDHCQMPNLSEEDAIR